MDTETQRESLDYCLVKITNPLNKQIDDGIVQQLLSIIKETSEGSQIALQFIAHKIQSPQEIESIQALNVLDLLVQKCDSSIISEIGKFRFLNELIKVVSPKYLAHRSTPKVKQFVIELIYKWTVEFRNETKIFEAYQMLKKQRIIFSDPIHVLPDRQNTPPPRRKDGIFTDEENSKTLHRLLQSKNPEDLQAANKLIKLMVKESDKKMSLKARCTTEIEIVCNNAKLLSEMLTRYVSGETTEEELELFRELFENCLTLRPKLFRLAAEIDEKDPELNEILRANDELTKVINEYKTKMGVTVGDLRELNEPNLLDLSSPVQNQQKLSDVALLTGHLVDLNVDSSDSSLKNNRNVLNDEKLDNDLNAILGIKLSCNGSMSTSVQQTSSVLETVNRTAELDERNFTPKSCLDELDQLMRRSVTTKKKVGTVTEKIPLNQLRTSPSCIDASDGSSMPSPLSDIFVPLESVEPTSVSPINLMDKSGIKVILNFGKGCPRNDVTVMVITILNTNKTAVSQVNFQAAVPKNMRVKLQPASSTSLPAYNPFLPPFAITQIMLIARNNWDCDKVRFKYRVSYSMNDHTFTEIGEIEHLFSTISL